MSQSLMNQDDKVRLGVLVPAVNTVVEPDLYKVVPDPFTVHFSRLPVPSDEATIENLERLEDHLEEAVQSLAQAHVNSIAFACTSGSFIKGPEWDQALIERMETIISPATTTSSAVVKALDELKIRKVALVTPYQDPINRLMITYFEGQGFNVTNLKSLGLKHSYEIRGIQPETIFNLAISADSKEVEAIVISCTDLQAMSVIDSLEKEIQKPVVTSNQATLWKLMVLSGTFKPIKGYGYLMEKENNQDSRGPGFQGPSEFLKK